MARIGRTILHLSKYFWYVLTMSVDSPKAFQEAFFRRHPGAQSVMALFDSLPNTAFYAKDFQSRFIRMNQLCLDINGASREEEVLGKTDRDFSPPVMAEAYLAEDRRVMDQEKPVIGQVWLVFHLRRLPHWYVSTKVPLFDPRGRVIGLAGAMYGITEPDERARYFRELYPVITHIEEHFAERISMARMAALAGLSSTHFNRRFQQLLRMTPMTYLHTVRVQSARRLLSSTQQPLADIAAETGYTDQSHFTRSFRQTTGMTPAEYRKRFQRKSQGA
jgi:AraC-like DNA-binding protein